MAHISRHDDILHILSKLRTVTVTELTQRTGVSEVTIRKDLKLLEEMGTIVRIHGGAQLAEDHAVIRSLSVRSAERTSEKARIARRAVAFIKEGDTIYLDSGSTCLALASMIDRMSVRVVTNSLPIMQTLGDAKGIVLLAVGGTYRREAGSFLGPTTIGALRGFRIETSFLGASGISLDGTFSAGNPMEAQVKREVISVSSRRVILADAAKIGKPAFSVFAAQTDVDVLITDEDATAGSPDLGSLIDRGIEVIIAD